MRWLDPRAYQREARLVPMLHAHVDDRDLRAIERGGQPRRRGQARGARARNDDACRGAHRLLACGMRRQRSGGCRSRSQRKEATTAGVQIMVWREPPGLIVHDISLSVRHVTILLHIIILGLPKIYADQRQRPCCEEAATGAGAIFSM